jgi:hypothetical protein
LTKNCCTAYVKGKFGSRDPKTSSKSPKLVISVALLTGPSPTYPTNAVAEVSTPSITSGSADDSSMDTPDNDIIQSVSGARKAFSRHRRPSHHIVANRVVQRKMTRTMKAIARPVR